MIRFGPAGNSDSFYEQGHKSSEEMPAWLRSIGLNAYEYQCGRGVKIGESIARKIGKQATLNDIFLSIHAPYYINLAGEEKEKRERSIEYIFETLRAAKWMGAKRIVVHAGSYSRVENEWAIKTVMEGIETSLKLSDELGYSDIHICPEVLGKANQLGTLEEILRICRMDDRLIPTIDFGHIHARGLGSLNNIEDFKEVLDKIENEIGIERLKHIHVHFSRIEFTKGGEKKHWTIDDVQFGPDFEPLAELISERDMEPVIICESRDKMAEDALKLKSIYEKAGNLKS